MPRDLTPHSDFATPPPRGPRPHPVAAPLAPLPIADHRFRDLLGRQAWARLPAAVQRRFSRPLAEGTMRVFRGHVAATRLSLAGRILARAARCVGSPLPDTDGATGPAVVTVTESRALGGQIWTRTYDRPGAFPQTINSVKRFAGPTGLEEYLGWGLIMRLSLHVEREPGDASCALVFRSAGYDWVVAGRRLPLPRLLTPGTCTIAHRDEGTGRFSFTLALDHPWLGRLVHQVAHFEEVAL